MSKIHDIIWKSNAPEEVKETVAPRLTPTTLPATPQQPYSYKPDSTTVSPDDSQMYEKLSQRTGVDQFPALAKIFSLAKPLEGIITDPIVRIQAAFAQAKTQGLTKADVTAALVSLDAAVEAEHQKFNASITARTAVISADEGKAADLEKQLHELRVAASDAKTKLDQAVTSFTSAINRRQNEVSQLKAQLASLGAN